MAVGGTVCVPTFVVVWNALFVCWALFRIWMLSRNRNRAAVMPLFIIDAPPPPAPSAPPGDDVFSRP